MELPIPTLRHIAAEGCFAMNGGTAINFFVHDLPHLSVDIDLTYLPVQSRDASLAEIEAALMSSHSSNFMDWHKLSRVHRRANPAGGAYSMQPL